MFYLQTSNKIDIEKNSSEKNTVSELEKKWNDLKTTRGFPSYFELRSLRKDFQSENLNELTELLKLCVEHGKFIGKQTDRTRLQWLVREIGDYIFELSGKLYSTSIYYYQEEEKDNISVLEEIPETKENFYVEYRRNPYFTGRREELESINEFFSKNSTSEIVYVALTGMGGIGKTQIAIKYAYRYEYKYSAVYWLQADNESFLFYSVVDLAEKLIPDEIDNQEDKIIAQKLKKYLEQQSNWLLILDNADDFDRLKINGSKSNPNADNFDDLRQYLPTKGDGHILITTRSPKPSFTLNDTYKIIPIYPFLPEEAEELLLRKIRDNFDPQSPIDKSELETISKIADELGMLPLAIDQAGSYIKAEQITFEQYLRDYRDREKGRKIRSIRGKLSGEHLSISTTYILALETIENKDKEAAELIRICAFFAWDKIPKKIFTESQNVEIWGGELTERLKKPSGFYLLCDNVTLYSLVFWNQEKELLSIHPVVQKVIQDQIDDDDEIIYIEKFIKAINGIFPNEFDIRFGREGRELLKSCDRLSNQVEKALEWIEIKSVNIIEAGYLLNKYSTYLLLRSKYEEAEDICEKAEILWRCLPTLDNSEQEEKRILLGYAQSLNNIGEVYLAQDQYFPDKDTEDIFAEALEIRQECLNENDDQYFLVGQSYHSLARLQTVLGKYSDGERNYKEALKINEKLKDNETLQPLLARNYHDLGQLYSFLGNYEDAKQNYEKAQEINIQVFGNKHLYVASNLEHLGDIAMAEFSYDEAEEFYLQALEIKQGYLRQEEHRTIADTYSRLGLLYLQLGESLAEHYYGKALEIRKKVLDQNHSDIASNYNDLAFLYQEQEDYEKAEKFYLYALRIYQVIYTDLEEKHISIAISKNNLANCYYRQGKKEEAEKYYQEVLKLLKQLNSENIDEILLTLRVLLMLVLVYQDLERYKEAESLFEESLTIKRQLSEGEDLIDVAYTLDDLAYLYQESERYSEAESLFKESLEIKRQWLEGEDLIDVAYTLDDLAYLYQESERYSEAESLFKESLEIKRQWLEGEDLIEVAYSLDNLALLYQDWGKHEEVDILLEEANQIKQELLGDD